MRTISSRISALVVSTSTPVLFLLPLSATAASTDDNFFQSLQTSTMTVLTQDQCASNMADLSDPKLVKANNMVHMSKTATPQLSNGIGWAPTGAPNQPVDPNCTGQKMRDLIYNGSDSVTDQTARISQFFNTCGPKLNAQNSGPLMSLIGLVTAQYDVCHAPRIRNVVFKLPDGTIVRGLLGMQNSTTEKRPMIIAKGGVFANTGDLSHKLLLMHLFDEGVFNVLVLSSSSGAEYIRDNTRVAVGGYEEGTEMLRIAAIMKSSPIANFISSYHVSGLSLGGNAALYASTFNDMYEAPPISSFLSICPVVDLQTAMHDLFGDPVKGPLAQGILAFDLSTIANTDPQFQSLATMSPANTPDAVAQYATQFYETRVPGWELPVDQDPVTINNTTQFWQANNFLNQVSIPQKSPHMLIAAADDWIVNPTHNTAMVTSALGTINQTQMGTVETPHGNHCAFSLAYGWNTISNLFRSYVLSHSPELQAFQRTRTPAGINFTNLLSLGSQEKNWTQSFAFAAGKNQVTVTFKIWTGEGVNCSPSDITQSSMSCVRTVSVNIPLSSLNAPWAKVPENSTEAESLTRWANTNVSWKTAAGNDVFGLSRPPSYLSWTDYKLRSNATGTVAGVANPQ